MTLKLKGRLILFSLFTGLLPLLVTIFYVGYSSRAMLEDLSIDFLKAKIDGYAGKAEIRYKVLMENVNIAQIKTLKEDLIKEASKERFFKTGYVSLFSPDGTCIYHPKTEYQNNTTLYNGYDYIKKGINQREGLYMYAAGGIDQISYIAYINGLNWIVWSVVPKSEVLAKVTALTIKMFILLLIASSLVVLLGAIIATKISKRAKEISNMMMDIAQGEADLSKRLPVHSTDEIGEIASWFNTFVGNLEEVITSVKHSSEQVGTATQEVTAGAQGLSQATQEQASSIEEVAATIEQMTSSIKHNADNATDGRQKATDMVRMASQSGDAAQELVRGMSEISQASKKIGDIIVTVNEVAFQTNLLALNAAVEAARAGEHGKGFAVVAEEVRALAQRSADASRQIKALIEDTVGKISAGDIMVKKSGESLDLIIKHIQDLSQVMEEIAAASSEQASGVDELNRAVSQIDTTTQQNASTVEELASTSDNLSNEANELASTVARFKVSKDKLSTKVKRNVLKNQQPVKSKAERTKAVAADFEDDFEEF
jgi:methyl-accepting chemotaxis protein